MAKTDFFAKGAMAQSPLNTQLQGALQSISGALGNFISNSWDIWAAHVPSSPNLPLPYEIYTNTEIKKSVLKIVVHIWLNWFNLIRSGAIVLSPADSVQLSRTFDITF